MSIRIHVDSIGQERQSQRISTKIVEQLELTKGVSRRQEISTAVGHIGFSEGRKLFRGILYQQEQLCMNGSPEGSHHENLELAKKLTRKDKKFRTQSDAE